MDAIDTKARRNVESKGQQGAGVLQSAVCEWNDGNGYGPGKRESTRSVKVAKSGAKEGVDVWQRCQWCQWVAVD